MRRSSEWSIEIGLSDADRGGVISRIAKLCVIVRTDQRIGHDLVQSPAGEHVAQLVDELPRLDAIARHGRVRQPRGHLVVADDAHDFFGDVLFDRDVTPVRRDDRHELVGTIAWVGLDADSRKRGSHLVGGRVGAQQSVDPRWSEGHAVRLFVGRVGVKRSRRNAPAGPFREQLGRPIGADARESGLLALLETQARLTAQRIPESSAPYRDGIENRRLDDHCRRRLADLAAGAAHHAGNADRPARVGDDECVRRQVALHMIERLEPLPVARGPDHDLAATDCAGVERVDGLAHLEHHVVARVDRRWKQAASPPRRGEAGP